MSGSYNPWLVTLSVFVATAVSYMALHLAAQVAGARGRMAGLWLAGGAFAMGGAFWSMHFIGMLALRLPIPLSYDVARTFGSLGVAVATAAAALALASRARVTLPQLGLSALVMGLGICAMHCAGMSALQVAPAPHYQRGLSLAAAAIAVGASFLALWLFFRLRGRSQHAHLARAAAAILMGLAISGMHYTAMAATRFAADSYGTAGEVADNGWLAVAIVGLALGLSAIATLSLLYNVHLQNSRRHSEALEQANAQLQHYATHDALTGLPNRLLLADRLEQAIAHADRHGTHFALLLVDLDHFKAVNDSLGHAAGDELLSEVARRLRASVRRSDTLARFGGDEFVLIINDVAAAQEIEGVIRSVCECLTRPIELADLEVHVSLSVGVSIYPGDGADRETLLKHADVAMYQAKRAGRNGFQFYAPAMNAFTRDRLVLENELRRAVRASEFQLLYQPQASTIDGRIESVEALIRWNHPRRGLLPAAAFIPLAEESGLIIPIGEWVLREACRQGASWRAEGMPLRVAVNLSAQQLRQKELPDTVRAALAASGLAPTDLELELTETVVMQEAESSVHTLRRVRDLGVSIAVDDFGTGYSSLSYLRRLPLRRLKIDHSFVRDLPTGHEAAEIVRAIVSLAACLDLRVIAEGVETREQLETLERLGCEQFQGFYCSAPLAATQLAARMAEWERLWRRTSAARPRPLQAVAGEEERTAEEILALSQARM